MATKFLDKIGLSYFCSKIKAWCNATFATITHNHNISNIENLSTTLSDKINKSGDTVTGTLIAGTFPIIKRNITNGILGIYSGDDTDSGARLILYGGTYASEPGRFAISASIDDSTYSQLLGYPDGRLLWNGTAVSLNGHNQASNTINTMTGYSKPNSGSAIAISDSLNSAIGKLEAKVDIALDDSEYVHLANNETITGRKIFTDYVRMPCIEFKPSSNSNTGGYIDFHYKGTEEDHTSRIAEYVSGKLWINGIEIISGSIFGNLHGYSTWLATNFDPVGNNVLVFTSGQIAQGTSAGTAYGGSSNDPSLFSYPESGTSSSQGVANIQNIRLSWSDTYWTDIFASPNNYYLWHRCVQNNFATPWRRIVEENVTGITAPNWNININGVAQGCLPLTGGEVTGVTAFLTQLKIKADGNNKYTVYLRNDGNNFWILTTNANDPNGGYNGLRPFWITLHNNSCHTAGSFYLHHAAFAHNAIPNSNQSILIGAKDTSEIDTHSLIFLREGTTGTQRVHVRAYCYNDTSKHADVIVGYDPNNVNSPQFVSLPSAVYFPDNSGTRLIQSNGTGYIDVGTHANNTYGGHLILYGNTYNTTSAYSGGFRLRTAKNGNWYDLYSYFSQYLMWSGREIATNVDDKYLRLDGSSAWDHGASILVTGKDFTNYNGKFILTASNGSASKTLDGRPDGTLIWNGNALQTTSDERVKTVISNVSEDVLDAWESIEWIRYKYKEDVNSKGEENCRYHTGLIAQHVNKACSDVNILEYGILCHDTALVRTDDDKDIPNDIWTVRYTEALCMEAAYQRRKNKILENRISELETQVQNMLQIIENLKGA